MGCDASGPATPGPEQSPSHSRRVWVCVSTASTPVRSSSPCSPSAGGAGSRRPTPSCWRRMRRRPRASRRLGRTACGSGHPPQAWGWIWTSSRAHNDATAGLAGVGGALCLFPSRFPVLALYPLLGRDGPFPAHGPSQSCARHSEVPGHVPGLATLVNTCSGMVSPACPLLSFTSRPFSVPSQAFPPPSAQTQGPGTRPRPFSLSCSLGHRGCSRGSSHIAGLHSARLSQRPTQE